MKTAVRVLLLGAKGRMGQAIAAVAPNAGIEIAAGLDLGDDIAKEIEACDVVIDFSHPNASGALSHACRDANKPAVIGTTGHSKEERAALEELARSVPVVLSPNFSVGVNALFWLTRKAAQMLGENFDLEVTEMHHRLKKDAPSGTALKMADILARAVNRDLDQVGVYARKGLIGERTKAEIGMQTIRAGDIVGDHTVIFGAVGERIEVTHRAHSRDTFASGALRAAAWVVTQPPGLYDMLDVLRLR